jgi:hypothetical protein
VHVIATTTLIEHLGKSYAGPALGEWDARFAVVVTVESVSEDAPEKVKPGPFAFAVHSPTHVFAHVCASDEAIGKRFRFELERVNDKWWRIVAQNAE